MKSKAEAQDQNLFSELVNMDDIVRSIESLIAESPEANALRKDTQLKPIIGSFFDCLREQKRDYHQGCISGNKAATKHCKKINQSILNA